MAAIDPFRPRLKELARQHGISRLQIFGSLVRGEETALSDVDFLAELAPGRTLLDLGGFQMDAEDLLRRRVDVVTAGALHRLIRDQVLAEAQEL